MQTQLIESMRDHVRTIYRVVTGTEMPDQASDPESEAPLARVTQSFAELEALTRTIPVLAERIPPFSFTPALDALVRNDEVILEAVVPGVNREDVAVEWLDGMLVISGVRCRSSEMAAASYSYTEIPHGPFYRTFRVPFAIAGEPTVDLDRGLLRIRLKRTSKIQQEEETSTPHSNSNSQ